VSAFPIALYDTSESIATIKEAGMLQAEGLLPAPEGATEEARQEAQGLLQQWAELYPTLPVRQADSVVAHRAALHASGLHEDYAATAEALLGWHGRCLALLSLGAGPAAVKAADLSKALDMVHAQRSNPRPSPFTPHPHPSPLTLTLHPHPHPLPPPSPFTPTLTLQPHPSPITLNLHPQPSPSPSPSP
jgi:hypothetical protein